MPRKRSSKVSNLKEKLITRIQQGFLRPGDRFLSNRALASRFGISYQTAHRLIAELCAENWLERRPGSGTYLPGERHTSCGVQLLFHSRAKRAGSFGARLLTILRERLDIEKVPFKVSFIDARPRLTPAWYPVIWECRSQVETLLAAQSYALLLNDIPAPGLASSFIDSVSTDDFSGGVSAAELLLHSLNHGSRVAVLAGPRNDARSQNRVAGFQSVFPRARVYWSDGWYPEHGLQTAPAVLKGKPAGVFCCNDRLAEALLRCAVHADRTMPKVIGFDNAPVAEDLNLTTIAIPWEEMADTAMAVIKRRLRGDSSTATRHVLVPRPMIRQ